MAATTQENGEKGVSESMQEAVTLHRSGRLADALAAYQQILKDHPGQAEALHLGGLAAFQLGDAEQGLRLVQSAADARPDDAEIQNNLGVMWRALGQLGAAETAFRKGVARAPDNAELHKNLGTVLQASGRYDDAERAYRQAVALAEDFANALNGLGTVLDQTGRSGEAVEAYRRAIHADPRFAGARNNLAIALRNLGRPEDSLEAIRQVLEMAPNYAAAYNTLGNVLRDLLRYDEAAQAFGRALALDPDNPDVLCNLGRTLGELGRPDEAAASLERALDIDPGLAEAHNNLAAVRESEGRTDDALAGYARAVELKPDHVLARGNLAHLLERTGRLEAARAALSAGLEAFPEDPMLNCVAARLARRAGRGDEAAERLARIADEAPGPNLKAAIHLERAHLHEAKGEGAEALAHAVEANRLAGRVAAARGADKTAVLRLVERLGAYFTEDWVAGWPPAGADETGEAPIFLVGFPRSGTASIGRALGRHPGLELMADRPLIEACRQRLGGGPRAYPARLAELSGDEIDALRRHYRAGVAEAAEARPGRRVIDGLPLNMIHAGLIARLFPEAKIVLALRHPCDVCLSCFMDNFGLGDATANFFSLDDTVAFYAKVMALWQRYRRTLPLSVHALRYEDLFGDAKPHLRGVLGFLGLAWDDAVLAAADEGMGRAGADAPGLPAAEGPASRWRRYTDAFEPFMDTLGPFIVDLGYPL